ncbi:MAG: hypothetical protein ABR524_10805 [Thermoanaerobaculia bacterium]
MTETLLPSAFCGEEGLNYRCAGYRAFFNHVGSSMKAMAQLIRAGRPAAAVMAR